MTSSSPADTRIFDIGPPEWCWSRLADAEEGILSYATVRGRVALAVPYAVANRRLTIPLGAFNRTGWSAVDAEATLEVSGADADDRRWMVRATGTAQRAEAGLVLPVVRLRGCYESPPDLAPAAQE